MAIAEVTDVGLTTDTEYVKCAHIIHWVKDYFDSRCDDTYCMVCLDDDLLLRGLANEHPEIDASEVIAKLANLRHVVTDTLDKQNIKLADFISKQDGFFYMKSSGESIIGDYDGDEFDCGTYVEAVLEDLETRYDIPIGTHTCKIVEDLVRNEYPTMIDQLPVEYIPVQNQNDIIKENHCRYCSKL